MKITDFCRIHNACQPGIDWAEATGLTDMRELWECDDIPAEYRIWIATREGVLSEKDARLFACWCVRQVWHLLADERSRDAVEVAERFANGEATKEELDAARDAASDAARDAGSAASATWAAAYAAASAAASAAACSAAMTARFSAMDAQASYLRKINVNL